MEKECENISSKENELAGLPVRRLFFKLAVPAVTAQVINVTYNMVDRMFIGHIPKIGADALTGVGVTMPVILGISAFAALVSMGGAPRASIALSEVKESIINAYVLKTGLSRPKLSHLMDAETWMDANKAVELGFADEIMTRAKAEPEKELEEGEGDTDGEKEEEKKLPPPTSSMLFSRR